METLKPQKPKSKTLKPWSKWHKKATPVLEKINQDLEKDLKRKKLVNALISGF